MSGSEKCVEDVLWNIFTCYSMSGNVLDPEHISSQQFQRFCIDCKLIPDPTLPKSSNQKQTKFIHSEANIFYVTEATKLKRNDPIKKMNYNDFLTALMKMGFHIYVPRESETVEGAFELLLVNDVLPNARRRVVPDISEDMANSEIVHLKKDYSSALMKLFQFYGSIKEKIKKKEPKKVMAFSSTISGTQSLSEGRNVKLGTMKENMGYQEFLKFGQDFKLSHCTILSAKELGEIYLNSIHRHPEDIVGEVRGNIRKLNYDDFFECLVRSAKLAYDKISIVSAADKLRALFLYMWRAVNKAVTFTIENRLHISTYHGDLIEGSMEFSKLFAKRWSDDKFRDYLTPETVQWLTHPRPFMKKFNDRFDNVLLLEDKQD